MFSTNYVRTYAKNLILLLLMKSLNVSVQSVLFIIHPLNSILHNLAKVLSFLTEFLNYGLLLTHQLDSGINVKARVDG